MNIYKEYFDTLKYYLTILKIDNEKEISGCNEEDITKLKSSKENFPIAYEEYLRSIGNKFLFDFMDAENMSFEDLDYINKFANHVFEYNSLKLEKEYLVISERRHDYISLIFTDEENPKVWIMSEYWDEKKGDNLSIRTDSFTDLMNLFFRQTLRNHTASFHFVPSRIKNTEKYIKNKYLEWSDAVQEIKLSIKNNHVNNPLINKLNEEFLNYYHLNVNLFNELENLKVNSNSKKLN